MPKKKTKSTKTRSKKRKSAVRGSAKFHGVVTHRVEGEGAAIADGTPVVVAIEELSFGKLPEGAGGAEVQFDVGLATTDAMGKAVSVNHNSGVFYYIKDDSRLSVDDWVIFDGPVHQHLSLRAEITEVENARKKQKELVELVKAMTESVGKLPIDISDPVSDVLGIIPSIYGAILRANADDQVLLYLASLFTEEVAGGNLPALVNGLHVFEKRKSRGANPFVTLKLRVRSH